MVDGVYDNPHALAVEEDSAIVVENGVATVRG